MNFFKLRILNTSLIFVIGILLGFIIKDKIFTVHIKQEPSSINVQANWATGVSAIE